MKRWKYSEKYEGKYQLRGDSRKMECKLTVSFRTDEEFNYFG